MRVNLKRWIRVNRLYVIAWTGMGLALLGLVARELEIYTLIIIVPFLPQFIIAVAKMAQELRR